MDNDFKDSIKYYVPSKEEREKVYIEFIKTQVKGYFITLELIKEQIELLTKNKIIDDSSTIYARIKGISSAVFNDAKKNKTLDDCFRNYYNF